MTKQQEHKLEEDICKALGEEPCEVISVDISITAGHSPYVVINKRLTTKQMKDIYQAVYKYLWKERDNETK
jgi:hypothetical protein